MDGDSNDDDDYMPWSDDDFKAFITHYIPTYPGM